MIYDRVARVQVFNFFGRKIVAIDMDSVFKPSPPQPRPSLDTLYQNLREAMSEMDEEEKTRAV